jgi:RNA polymerase sigma-70 factor (ECF subfamily)
LVIKAKTDNSAFDTLYERYFPKIYNFVAKRTGEREEAEDIVSATFMQAFTHLEKYECRNCTFGAWLYKIAANKLIDHYRKQSGKPQIFTENTADTEIKHNIDLDLQAKKVRLTLKEMPAKYQKVIGLKFFSELSNAEIAQAMDVSLDNAYVLLFRALKKFKKYYKQYEI